MNVLLVDEREEGVVVSHLLIGVLNIHLRIKHAVLDTHLNSLGGLSRAVS